MRQAFMTLSQDGRSRAYGVENTPPKPEPCSCGTCKPTNPDPPPFDPAENREHALRLERQADEAERQGRTAWARELRGRALLVHDLNEAHDREAARREARRIGTSWKPSTILG